MGIDFPTKDELIAGRFQNYYGDGKYIEEIRKTIGADTLLYQKLEDLYEAIGLGKDQLCHACLTGKYPLKSLNSKLIEMEKIIAEDRS